MLSATGWSKEEKKKVSGMFFDYGTIMFLKMKIRGFDSFIHFSRQNGVTSLTCRACLSVIRHLTEALPSHLELKEELPPNKPLF